jgi:hypothetical protein
LHHVSRYRRQMLTATLVAAAAVAGLSTLFGP